MNPRPIDRRSILKAGLGAGAGALAAPLSSPLAADPPTSRPADAPARTARGRRDDRPNILLVLVDDMGYSDPGFMGGEVRTPNVDRLSRRGLTFTNCCNNGKCLPTRQSLLGGNYARYAGNQANVVALGQAMKYAGYGSYMTGKVHGHSRFDWDRSVTMFAAGSHWAPKKVWVNGFSDETFLDRHPEFYSSDVWTDYALEYLDDHVRDRPDDPFFLYLAFNAPHDPLHAPEADIARYEGVFDVGWDEIRRRRHRRLIQRGLLDKDVELPPKDPTVPDWKTVTGKQREYELRKMMVYAAMVDRIDQNVGRVMTRLEATGQADNTLVIFLSDNGANRLTYGNPDKDMPGPKGTGHALGKFWASASNSPYSGYKSSNYEGGGRTPAVFCWPDRVKPGTVDHEFLHVTDITATCLDLAGLPHERILGKTLTPTLDGKQRELHDEVGFGFRSAHAYREGDWKLVRFESPTWQLYDMRKDPTEIHDLASRHPDVVRRLERKWIEWNKQVVYRGQDKNLRAIDQPMEYTLIELNL
jgi:arylsulfatase